MEAIPLDGGVARAEDHVEKGAWQQLFGGVDCPDVLVVVEAILAARQREGGIIGLLPGGFRLVQAHGKVKARLVLPDGDAGFHGGVSDVRVGLHLAE